MDDTRSWAVKTVAGFVLLAVWIASIISPPIVVLAAPVQAAIFVGALGALGLSVFASGSAVKTVTQIKSSEHLL